MSCRLLQRAFQWTSGIDGPSTALMAIKWQLKVNYTFSVNEYSTHDIKVPGKELIKR